MLKSSIKSATYRRKTASYLDLAGLAGLALDESQDIVLRRIQLILDSRGLDRGDLAAGIGRSKAAVSQYFNKHRKIDLPTLDRIAKFFKIHPWQLLVDDDVPPRSDRTSPDERAEDAIRTLLRMANLKLRVVRDKGG